MSYLCAEYEEAHEKRLLRRRRLVSAVRGWIFQSSSPRGIVTACLMLSISMASASSALLYRFGVHSLLGLFLLGLIVSWPLFLLLLQARAFRLLSEFDLHREFRPFILRDEACEQQNGWEVAKFDREIWPAMCRGIGNGAGRGGGMEIPALIFLVLVTAGTWLIWDLIQQGPTLLAETFVDHTLCADPRLLAKVHTRPWLQNIIASTAVHFIGVTLCSFLAVMVIKMLAGPM